MVGVAVLLRVVALAEPVRFDEAVTQLLFVSRAWSVAASSYPFPNNHVLYTLLAKLTAPLAPDEPWAMRLPAFAAGVAIIPLTAAVGRRFVNENAGLLGAAIAAGATQLVLYSANARGYSLVTALFLALLLGVSHLRERPSRRGWMLFTLGAAAGFYAIPTMAYAYAVIGAWIALDVATRRSRPAAELLAQFSLASVAAAALTWLLYLPVIRHAGLAALTGNKFVRPAGWWRVKYFGPPAFSDLVTTWGEPLPHAAAPALFAIAVAGVVWHHRQARRLPSLTFAVLLGCGAVFGITRRLPFTRVWLFLPSALLRRARRGYHRCPGRVARANQGADTARIRACRLDRGGTSAGLARDARRGQGQSIRDRALGAPDRRRAGGEAPSRRPGAGAESSVRHPEVRFRGARNGHVVPVGTDAAGPSRLRRARVRCRADSGLGAVARDRRPHRPAADGARAPLRGRRALDDRVSGAGSMRGGGGDGGRTCVVRRSGAGAPIEAE